MKFYTSNPLHRNLNLLVHRKHGMLVERSFFDRGTYLQHNSVKVWKAGPVGMDRCKLAARKTRRRTQGEDIRQTTSILYKHRSQKARKPVEAAHISNLSQACVSQASVTLHDKEISYLGITCAMCALGFEREKSKFCLRMHRLVVGCIYVLLPIKEA